MGKDDLFLNALYAVPPIADQLLISRATVNSDARDILRIIVSKQFDGRRVGMTSNFARFGQA